MTKKSEIVIKKYPNRRLYNTATSSYITLEEIAEIIKEGTDFKVVDAKTNKDLTHSTLTQIILDQETKGYNVLPSDFLKYIIKIYKSPMSKSFSQYLSYAIAQFEKSPDLTKVTDALNTNEWKKGWADINEQNKKIFDSMFGMFYNQDDKKK